MGVVCIWDHFRLSARVWNPVQMEFSAMFEGIFTALITPFKDGQLDGAALDALIDRQLDAGVDGLVPCGTTGESATLSVDESLEVIARTVGRVALQSGRWCRFK